MLTPGHLAASYLIAQIPRIYGYNLPLSDQIYILTWGNLIDFDVFLSKALLKRGGHHHFLFTHTPVISTGIYLFTLFFSINYFSKIALLLGFISLFIHLVLDDVSYWFHKIGLNNDAEHPQIFWLFPFDKRRKIYLDKINNGQINYSSRHLLKIYLTKSYPTLFLEIILIIVALFLLFFTK